MKIGIIVYSYSGNTLKVAQQLQKKLEAQGHQVGIKPIQVQNSQPTNRMEQIILTNSPPVDEEEALVLAAPVWAFSLCPIIRVYLAQLKDQKGKPCLSFVTQAAPFGWLGGNKALRLLKADAQKAGLNTLGQGCLGWKGRDLEGRMEALTSQLASALSRKGGI